MTSLLDTLERRGLVTRRPHPQDRRKILVELTDPAYAVVDPMLPLVHAAMTEAFEALAPAERQALVDLLGRVQAQLAARSRRASRPPHCPGGRPGCAGSEDDAMRTTMLGSAGPEVGVIGLGCMGMTHAYDMATPRDEESSIAVIRRAIDLGMTLIDTADIYGPFTNEELVGRALAGGYRERAVLATKVGMVQDQSDTTRNGRPEHVRAGIDASLRRLGTDHVDLWQLHRVDPQVPVEETWGAMAEAVAAGKALRLGLSEVTVEEISRAQAVHPVTSVQSELSLWTRDPLADVLPACEAQGIAFLPFSPLGRGFLTGRFSSFDELPQDDFRRRLPRFQQDALRANLAIVDRVQQVAERVEATPAQVALAWVLSRGRYVVPIPGTKTPRYLADNAGAADVQLSEADLTELDSVPAPSGARY